MSTRPPWPARWGIYSRPTVTRYAFPTGQTFKAGALLGYDFLTIQNGDFAAATGWTVPGNWSIGSGVASHTAGSADLLYQDISAAIGVEHTLSVAVTAITGGGVTPRLGGTNLDTITTSDGTGTYEMSGAPVSSGRVEFSADASFVGSIDDVTVRVKDQLVELTSIDPTNLFAIAAEGAAEAIESGFVMVYELDTSLWVGMMGTRDPQAGDVGTQFGIVQNSKGHWVVDLSDTSNLRVEVQDVDLVQKYYFVTFLSAILQS